MKDDPVSNAAAKMPERLAYPVPNAADKYRLEIISGYCASVVMIAMGFIVIAMMEAYGVEPSLRFLQGPAGYTGIILGSVALGVLFYRHTVVTGRRERNLVKAHPGGPALVLTKDGVECSLALMEGEPRKALLKAGRAVLDAPWDQIGRWVVDPSRSSGNQSSPPYFILELKSGEKVWILRKPFEGHEREIVEFAAGHLKEAVVLNDELR